LTWCFPFELVVQNKSQFNILWATLHETALRFSPLSLNIILQLFSLWMDYYSVTSQFSPWPQFHRIEKVSYYLLYMCTPKWLGMGNFAPNNLGQLWEYQLSKQLNVYRRQGNIIQRHPFGILRAQQDSKSLRVQWFFFTLILQKMVTSC